jgi:hypothetical protein
MKTIAKGQTRCLTANRLQPHIGPQVSMTSREKMNSIPGSFIHPRFRGNSDFPWLIAVGFMEFLSGPETTAARLVLINPATAPTHPPLP